MSDYPYSSGWTCAICGQFVGFGQTHNCYGTVPPYNLPPTYHTYIDNILAQRIAAALEKIVEILENRRTK